MHLTHSIWKINVVSVYANVSGIAGSEIYEPIQETEFIRILSKTYKISEIDFILSALKYIYHRIFITLSK